jgi:hypothetical protein
MEDSASYTIQNKLASELSNVLESKTKNLIQLLVKLVDNDIKEMLIFNRIEYKDIHVKPDIEHDILKYIIN